MAIANNLPDTDKDGKARKIGGTVDMGAYEAGAKSIEISIDIKLGSEPNSINLKSKGVVPVAVLTTADFDASSVNPGTVVFAGAKPQRWTSEDVDGDGNLDLLFHFKIQEADLEEGSTTATLTGKCSTNTAKARAPSALLL